MTDKFSEGDRVKWRSHGGEAHGTVEKRQTSRTPSRATLLRLHQKAHSSSSRRMMGKKLLTSLRSSRRSDNMKEKREWFRNMRRMKLQGLVFVMPRRRL